MNESFHHNPSGRTEPGLGESDRPHPDATERRPSQESRNRRTSVWERLKARFLGYDVFISYAHKDGLAYAMALENNLRRRDVFCFRDANEIPLGASIDETIQRALRSSRVLIVVSTPHALASTAVGKEIREFPSGRSICQIELYDAFTFAEWVRLKRDVIRVKQENVPGEDPTPSFDVLERLDVAFTFFRCNTLARLVAWTTLTLLLALVAGLIVSLQRSITAEHEAIRQRDMAQMESRVSSANAVAARSSAIGGEYPHHASLLAAAAPELLASGDPRVPGVEQCLRNALLLCGGEAKVCSPPSPIVAMDVAQDAHELFVATKNGGVQRWRLNSTGKLANPTTQPPVGNTNLTAFAVSPNGTWTVAGYEDGGLVRWSKQGEPVTLTKGKSGYNRAVTALAFTSDAKKLITIGRDGFARVWPMAEGVKTGHVLFQTEKFAQQMRRPLSCLAISANGQIAFGTESGYLYLFDNAEARVFTSLLFERGTHVSSVRFSPDGTMLAASAYNGELRLWRTPIRLDGPQLILRKSQSRGIHYLSFSPASDWLVATTSDSSSTAWRVGNGKVSEPILLSGHTHVAHVASFDPENRWLVTAGSEGRVLFWDLTTDPLSLAGTLRGHQGAVRSLTWETGTNGAMLYTGGDDGIVRRWNWNLPNPADPLVLRSSGSAQLLKMDLRTRRPWLVEAKTNNDVCLWDFALPNPPQNLRRFVGHGERVNCADVSPDGEWMATGDGKGRVFLWATRHPEQPPKILNEHENLIQSVAFVGQDWLISQDFIRKVVRWRLHGKFDHEVIVDRVSSSKLACRAGWLALGDPDGKVTLWRIDRETIRTFPLATPEDNTLGTDFTRMIAALEISDDGRFLAAARARTVLLWKLQEGTPPQLVRTWRDPEEYIAQITLSLDGSLLAWGNRAGLVRWTSTADQSKSINEFIAHPESIGALGIDPGNEVMITGSSGGMDFDPAAKLWRLADGKMQSTPITLFARASALLSPTEIRQDERSADLLRTVQFGHDGKWAATVHSGGMIRLVPMKDEVLLRLARQRNGRAATAEEWRRHLGWSTRPPVQVFPVKPDLSRRSRD